MKPVANVVPGCKDTVYAKDQLAYLPLPTYKSDDGVVTSKWKLTWREKLRLLFGGHIYLQLCTFNKPLQPIKIQVGLPDEYDTACSLMVTTTNTKVEA